MEFRTDDGPDICGRGHGAHSSSLGTKLADLEIRRNMLISAMAKYQDAKRSQLFRVLNNNDKDENENENESEPLVNRYSTSVTTDANGSEMATRRPPYPEVFDDEAVHRRASSTPISNHEASYSYSYSSCDGNLNEKATYARRKSQLLSSLYRRQSISESSQTVPEKETTANPPTNENEPPVERNPWPNARPLLAVLTPERIHHKSCGAMLNVNNNSEGGYYETNTPTIEYRPSRAMGTEHDNLCDEYLVFRDENEAPPSHLPHCDARNHCEQRFPIVGKNRNSRGMAVGRNQSNTTKFGVDAGTNYFESRGGEDALVQIADINTPTNISNGVTRDPVFSLQKEGTATPISHIVGEKDVSVSSTYQGDSSDFSDPKESIGTSSTTDEVPTTLDAKNVQNPKRTEGSESRVTNDDDDFNKVLERKLDMMILGNPLWQKALQDTYETSLEGDMPTTTTTTEVKPVGSAGAPDIAPYYIENTTTHVEKAVPEMQTGGSTIAFNIAPHYIENTTTNAKKAVPEMQTGGSTIASNIAPHYIENTTTNVKKAVPEMQTGGSTIASNIAPHYIENMTTHVKKAVPEMQTGGSTIASNIAPYYIENTTTNVKKAVPEMQTGGSTIASNIAPYYIENTTTNVKKAVLEMQTGGSPATSNVAPDNGTNTPKNGSTVGCKEPIYLDSNQWPNTRPDSNVETPLASNVRNHGRYDFGVTSELSDNSSDSESASSASKSSKEDFDDDDVVGDGDGEDCDDYTSDDSSEKPPVPSEVHTITTDFTIQSIELASTQQTNIESLGDESLVKTNELLHGVYGARTENTQENEDGAKGTDSQTYFSLSTQSLYSVGLKKLFENPSILCQCTGPIAMTKVTSPSHGIFGDKELADKMG